MNAPVPRVRVFAGPNGSGKSTVKDYLPEAWLGIYVNADEIERDVRERGFLNFGQFEVDATNDELSSFFASSVLLAKAGLLDQAQRLKLAENELYFGSVAVNSYFASVIADFLRHKLLVARKSFTFETVMSSPDKVAFLKKAQEQGFRTYLYYVATEDPAINIARVHYRVETGGHPVPEDKIVSRYGRSLELLADAVSHADRAYIFDNSGHQMVWVAEVTGGNDLELKSDQMPAWFKAALWDKFE